MFTENIFHEKGVKTSDMQKIITTQVSIFKSDITGFLKDQDVCMKCMSYEKQSTLILF